MMARSTGRRDRVAYCQVTLTRSTVRPMQRGRDDRADDPFCARLRRESAAAGPGTTGRGSRDPAALDAVTEGLLSESGTNPDQVLGVYTSMLAPAVISADSPRFLGFIPAAPTKASLLFDMLISCASIQGISWLEAAGAIHAENQVLRLIADRAGLPDSAGGCFVSGGSAGNLSALVVAREMAKSRNSPGGGTQRWRVAVGSDAHSSIVNTLRIVEMDALTVETDDHRLTGEALRKAIEDDGDPSSLAAVVATSGTTNAGIVDDLAGAAAVARDHGLWFHVDGAYGGRAVRPQCPAQIRRHRARRLVRPRPAQMVVRAVRLCGSALPRSVARALGAHPGRVLPRRHPRQAGRVEPDRLCLPLDQARGMPLWFSLAVHGVAAYTEAIETAIRLARETADEIGPGLTSN